MTAFTPRKRKQPKKPQSYMKTSIGSIAKRERPEEGDIFGGRVLATKKWMGTVSMTNSAWQERNHCPVLGKRVTSQKYPPPPQKLEAFSSQFHLQAVMEQVICRLFLGERPLS